MKLPAAQQYEPLGASETSPTNYCVHVPSLRARRLSIILLLWLLAILPTCGDQNPVKVGEPTWESLGFEDKLPLRMKCSGDLIYVCAGPDGLWRRNVSIESSHWEPLGLADSTYDGWIYGVQDVDVKGQDILVGYKPMYPTEGPGVWRSLDGGGNWARSDSGIPTEDHPHSFAYSVARSPHDTTVGYAMGSAYFRTSDGGSSWTLAAGDRGSLTNATFLFWNPFTPGELWVYGADSYWSPILSRSKDWGLTGEGFHLGDSLLALRESVVYDVAIDPVVPTTVYVGVGQAVVKSVDDGESWIVPFLVASSGRRFTAVECHPTVHNRVYFAAGDEVYRSTDAGQNMERVGGRVSGGVLSMVFHRRSGALIVGTESGVYRFIEVN